VDTREIEADVLKRISLRECLTIGHSNHTIEELVQLLNRHRVDVIVDVRSMPYSKRQPQFNREALQQSLRARNVAYLYMGDRLGARYSDPKLIRPDGRVDLKRVAELPAFQSAIQSIVQAVEKGHRIALMCSEGDPFDCHRFVLVSRALQSAGVRMFHILPDGQLVCNSVLEDRLLEKYFPESRDEPGLFVAETRSRQELVELAYDKRAIDVAYKAGTNEEEKA